MAKFNQPNTVENEVANEPTLTTNFEGGVAFEMSPEVELYTRVATSLVGEPKYYESGEDSDKAILGLIEQVAHRNPEFILQLAAYARNDLYLRSIPMVLLVEACRYPETKAFVRAYTPQILQRADELTEIVSYWIARNGHIGDKAPKGMLCNPLRRGIADSFANFNEYHFGKYDRDGAVKLKDVLRICHPAPDTPARGELYARIRDRTLKTPETWETVISGKGSTKENWESILPKMPFMARIRNLRNLLEKGVDVSDVIRMLNDPAAVLNSKQFPYRFLSAYKVVEEVENPQSAKVMDALEAAMDISCDNVPHWPGITLVATDSSGSMDTPVSEKSQITKAQIGFTLGAMAARISDGGFAGAFGDTWSTVTLNNRSGVLNNARKLEKLEVGHSTNAWTAVDWMLRGKVHVDRLVVFSDLQCYDSLSYAYDGSLVKGVTQYRRSVNPKLHVYSFDLAGYGTSQFPEKDKQTALLAGWSDKVLQMVPLFEQKKSVLEVIARVEPGTYRRRKKEEEAVE